MSLLFMALDDILIKCFFLCISGSKNVTAVCMYDFFWLFDVRINWCAQLHSIVGFEYNRLSILFAIIQHLEWSEAFIQSKMSTILHEKWKMCDCGRLICRRSKSFNESIKLQQYDSDTIFCSYKLNQSFIFVLFVCSFSSLLPIITASYLHPYASITSKFI